MKVIPSSKEEEVIEGSPLVVRVKEPPEKGKANIALLKLLSKHFGCEVRLISGFSGRRKRVELVTRA
ncbi:MAG: DUF167 domain-containing protein [Candidatus Hadarchaeales archaeon]